MPNSSVHRSSFDSPAPSPAFNNFVTPKLMRIAYPLGVFALCAFALASLVGDFGELPGHTIRYKFTLESGRAWFTLFYWIGFLVGSNLSWRIFCETTVVIFRIHELLARRDS